MATVMYVQEFHVIIGKKNTDNSFALNYLCFKCDCSTVISLVLVWTPSRCAWLSCVFSLTVLNDFKEENDGTVPALCLLLVVTSMNRKHSRHTRVCSSGRI